MRGRLMCAITAASVVLATTATTTGPATAATATKTLKSHTLKVKPSGKVARLKLTASGTTATVILELKVNGAFKVIAKRKLPKKLPAGVTDIRLSAGQSGDAYEKNGGQGLIAWTGPAEGSGDDLSQYYGWNIDKKRIEFF